MLKCLPVYLPKILTGGLFLFLFSSCERDIVPADGPSPEGSGSLRVTACSEFAYKESVLYLRNQPKDYIVKPVTGLAGTYGAKPYGLVIDPSTGAINVSKSETGLQYTVFYVKAGTSDTCTRDITIAGLDFANSLHVLTQNDVVVSPTFNGVSNSVTGTSSVEFGGLGAMTSSASLQNMGVAIDPLTASIDLKKILASGLLGVSPVNGASATVRLYYSIDDASQGALNHIDLRFTYFRKLSDVPAGLLEKIRTNNAGTVSSGARSAADGGGGNSGNKARPPEIVIVG